MKNFGNSVERRYYTSAS
jgi:hypothetical protein